MDKNSGTNEAADFFSGLMEWDSLKITTLVVNHLLTVTGICLLSFVVWYEKHSSDLNYRYQNLIFFYFFAQKCLV